MRIHATPQQAEFEHHLADMEIRYGSGDWPWLHAQHLLPDTITPMCSPALLARLPAPLTVERLLDAPLLHSERSMVTWTAWLAENGVAGGNVSRGIRFDRGYLAIQAAAAGLGVALESTVFGSREIGSGVLSAPFLDTGVHLPAAAHFLVCPPAHFTWPKVQQFNRWILDEARTSQPMTARRRR